MNNIIFILCNVGILLIFLKMYGKNIDLEMELDKLKEENLNLKLDLAKYDSDTINELFEEEDD